MLMIRWIGSRPSPIPWANKTVYGYDADGNQTSVKDPMGRITTTIYDALDRPTVVDRSRGQPHDHDVSTPTANVDGRQTRWSGSRPSMYATGAGSRRSTDPMETYLDILYTPTGKKASLTQQGQSGGSEPLSPIPTTPTTS